MLLLEWASAFAPATACPRARASRSLCAGHDLRALFGVRLYLLERVSAGRQQLRSGLGIGRESGADNGGDGTGAHRDGAPWTKGVAPAAAISSHYCWRITGSAWREHFI